MGRFKDSFLNDKKYIKETLIVLLGGIIINAACFLIGTIYSHAETVDSNIFPYYIDNLYSYESYDNINSFRDDYISQFKDVIYADFYSYSGLSSDTPIILDLYEVGDSTGSGYINLYLGVYTNPNVTDNISSSSLFSSTQVKINYDAFYYIQYRYYYQTNTFTYVTTSLRRSNYYVYLFGTPQIWSSSNLYDFPNTVQVLNYPMFMHNLDTLYSANNIPIVTFTPSLDVGDFTDLPNIDEILNDINNTWEPPSTITGHALPNQPTENPNNNDFQNRLQMFDYLKDSINSIVGNLGYNLKKWIDNLTGKMIEGFNSVSQNIWNGFKTLMDNIKDFFGPKIDAIIDKFEYITEPLDHEEINDYIESSDVYGDISSIQTSVTSFTGSLTGVSEPSSYSITLHIEDIGILHQEEPYVLSFDILNDVKVYIRGFLWCFCTYGLFISVVDSIANYINGGGGEDD